MFQRLCAITFILIATSIGWLILAGSLSWRTNNSDAKLRSGVSSTWGAPQEQHQPKAFLTPPPSSSPADTVHKPLPLSAESSRVNVQLALEHRKKGLLWYSTYVVNFQGVYTFHNPDSSQRSLTLEFPLPAQAAVYDGLSLEINGQPVPFSSNNGTVSCSTLVNPASAVIVKTSYRSQGLASWLYKLGDDITQTHDFRLVMHTNFKAVDFPPDTLSPTYKVPSGDGWELTWTYSNLISGYQIGMAMPDKLQPGPLVSQICLFAPISLLLFFFVMLLLTTLRGIDLHPINYFFLAAAFFSFHLLLSYLVDHLALEWSFLIASLVSVGLVVSYLRLVVGPRFAIFEAGGAQLLYLVLFSSTFFLQSFTGLAITIGCIATLFVSMQLTARVRWSNPFPISTSQTRHPA